MSYLAERLAQALAELDEADDEDSAMVQEELNGSSFLELDELRRSTAAFLEMVGAAIRFGQDRGLGG